MYIILTHFCLYKLLRKFLNLLNIFENIESLEIKFNVK